MGLIKGDTRSLDNGTNRGGVDGGLLGLCTVGFIWGLCGLWGVGWGDLVAHSLRIRV